MNEIYCGECAFFHNGGIAGTPCCLHDNNRKEVKTEIDKSIVYISGFKNNKNNDCSDFCEYDKNTYQVAFNRYMANILSNAPWNKHPDFFENLSKKKWWQIWR